MAADRAAVILLVRSGVSQGEPYRRQPKAGIASATHSTVHGSCSGTTRIRSGSSSTRTRAEAPSTVTPLPSRLAQGQGMDGQLAFLDGG